MAAPKSHFVEDIYIFSDITILATSVLPLRFVGRSSNIEGKNAMMDARWNMFRFTYQILGSEQENVILCSKCFSQCPFWEQNLKLKVIQILNESVNTD